MQTSDKAAFQTIAIVGVGLIGGSLAVALRRAGFQGEIIGVSSGPTIEEGLKDGVIDAGFEYKGLLQAASRADLIILASPIHRILDHIRELGHGHESLRSDCIITDVGSTMASIVEEAEASLPEKVSFIGGHPMAGSEKRGLSSADPFLFQNAFYILTPARNVSSETVGVLKDFLGTTGARMMVLDAKEHDRSAAIISHMPQLLSVVLVNFLEHYAENRDDTLRLAAGGFRDMTRVASSPFPMWRDIYETNGDEVRTAVDAFVQELRKTAELIGTDALRERFDTAAHTRVRIPRDSKGFVNPLWEVLVVVEDKPGIITTIAQTLSDSDINIKDIEVVKVREGEGGSLRLAFSTEAVARKAVRLLSAQDFSVRLRE